MDERIVEARACGKLYIAGEYAVVLNKPAILVPIKKYIYVKIKQSKDLQIKSQKYHPDYISFNIDDNDPSTVYICKTLEWFYNYIEELGLEKIFFQIEINSELDNIGSEKFGFGTSAAVTIALLKALFKYYNIEFDSLQLYKAGVLIQRGISRNSSYGDLACIAFETPIYYNKFSDELFSNIRNISITEILKCEWTGLVINKINRYFEFLIVNTNKPSSSYSLVKEVLKYKDEIEFIEFLTNSESLVNILIGENTDIKIIINKLQDNFKSLQKIINIQLITNEMVQIEKEISNYAGVLKISGAGGGDSVICFFDSKHNLLKSQLILENLGYPTYIYPLEVRLNEQKR